PPSRPERPSRLNGPSRPRRPRWILARRADPARRLGVTLLAISFVLTLFAGRLVQIQGMESGIYRYKAAAEKLTTLTLPALRGTIYGANGQILAMTVETYTVTADPPQIPAADRPGVAARLAGPLGMPAQQILTLLRHPTSPDYVVLAKNLPAAQGDKVSALAITGIYLTASYARAYPDGDATANVVGFTNVSQSGVISGQAGIELEYNKLLSGTPGSEQVEMSTDGQPIPLAGSTETPARSGTGIRLTIIPALQYAAQQACQQRVQQMHAKQCTVVIIQPKTGYILAMAQWPTYSQSTLASAADATDLPVQDVFQPGSTAKVITAAAAFEHGGQTPMSSYYIPYQIYEGGQWIRDAEWSPGEHYTIAGIIANSSNVGMSQVVQHVSPQVQYDYLRAFGLGEPSGLNLPGESAGILPPPSQWAADERYTLSFGQGVAVTAVQMASVYATIANDGVRVQPTLVEGTVSPSGQFTPAAPSPSRRVIQPKTARELISILQQVPAVDETADQPWGIIPGYAVAAKTGTSQEAGPGCALCEYGSSYIGMAPGNDPQVVVAVNVQDPNPKYGYYGDVVAGPVFYNVMKFALATLQIPPDGAVAPYVRLNAP
ncbi:penicillin-binding protein 2, partial [Trebonia sp.]|uniref:peptidoglycan D,D-transpeptidase FtsI family protein n=1 Tax=Trebonia sp. TaxID=2767075 RepID=UPI0026356E3F